VVRNQVDQLLLQAYTERHIICHCPEQRGSVETFRKCFAWRVLGHVNESIFGRFRLERAVILQILDSFLLVYAFLHVPIGQTFAKVHRGIDESNILWSNIRIITITRCWNFRVDGWKLHVSEQVYPERLTKAANFTFDLFVWAQKSPILLSCRCWSRLNNC